MKCSSTFATVLISFAWMTVGASCTSVDLQAGANARHDTDARQVLRLGRDAQAYPFLLYANADLYNPPKSVERAVVIIRDEHTRLAGAAKFSGERTLLLAPDFLTPEDAGASDDMPLWPRDQWAQGIESQYGHKGIPAFQVLDDVVHYLSDRQRFPALKEIIMVSHSAGAQLMQRYAVVNDLDPGLNARGPSVRYMATLNR